MKRLEEQLRFLKRRAVDVIPEADLVKKLERSQRTGKPLRVKLGVDPTSPDIHIGIGVVLQKLRDFQELGHTAVLIVGDFTARIGDPSERASQRKMLSKEEVETNMRAYREQALKILDPDRTEFRYNSEWLEQMDFARLLELASKYTVAAMLERDDFLKRFREGNPISIVEFLYPLAQGYDSVAIGADIELGGTDQRFNLLVGRALQERYGQWGFSTTSMPSTNARPLVGVSNVVKIFIRVVFPAPLGPSSPKSSPWRTSRLTSSRATRVCGPLSPRLRLIW
jgi:tyrosyl-tRNA synthetase